jgi:acyl carrier protein
MNANLKSQSYIISMIAKQLSIPESNITLETQFRRDLGVDSITMFELVMLIEETYGTTIDETILNKLVSVQAVCDYIQTI